MIYHDLRMVSDVFVKLSQEKNIVEEIDSIPGSRAERGSPSWVCISQKSLAITRDLWNTNSLGWTPFRTKTATKQQVLMRLIGIPIQTNIKFPYHAKRLKF